MGGLRGLTLHTADRFAKWLQQWLLRHSPAQRKDFLPDNIVRLCSQGGV
jgi:hypothetical protein